jgi:hypothetical protein
VGARDHRGSARRVRADRPPAVTVIDVREAAPRVHRGIAAHRDDASRRRGADGPRASESIPGCAEVAAAARARRCSGESARSWDCACLARRSPCHCGADVATLSKHKVPWENGGLCVPADRSQKAPAAQRDTGDLASPGGLSRADSKQRPSGLKRALSIFDSTTKTLLAVGGLIAAAAALWATISQLVPDSPRSAPPPGSQAQGSRAQGSRAPGAMFVVAPESCGALTFGADGAAGPVTCPDGRPNIAADHYYRQLHPRVLNLGPTASPSLVQKAICSDLAGGTSTFVIEAQATKLAEAEQNWHFGVDPAAEIGPGLCPAT